jgi:hypothetical protein
VKEFTELDVCLAVRKYVKHQYPVNAVSNCIQLLPFQHPHHLLLGFFVGAKVGTYVISTHKDERFTNIFFCTLTIDWICYTSS